MVHPDTGRESNHDQLDAPGAVLAAAGDLPHDVLLFLDLSAEVVGVRSFGHRSLREVENAGLTPDRVRRGIPRRSR